MGKHGNQPPKDPYDPDKTGYRNPPRKAQFPKGKSGNPRGRPAGAKGLKNDLKDVLGRVRTVTVAGTTLTGRSQWLMLETLALRASHGDVKAIAHLLPTVLQVLGTEDRDVDPNRLTPDEEAMLLRLMVRRGMVDITKKPAPARRKAKRSGGGSDDG